MSADATAPESPAACPNCGYPTPGAYCPTCGQRQLDRRVTLRRMIAEAVEDQFSLNATLPRTLKALLFHPGFLSREYVQGRIQRYIPPLRLYLVSSLLFFLVLSFVTHASPTGFRIDGLTRDSTGVVLVDSAGAVRIDSAGVVVVDSAGAVLVDSAGVVLADSTGRDGAIAAERARRSAAEAMRRDDWVSSIRFRSPIAVLDSTVNRKLRQFQGATPGEALRRIGDEAIRRAPTAAFLLLPVFALLLKVLYLRRRRYYVEHFVFGLHTHAFSFLLLLPLLLVDGWIEVPLMLWMLVYFYVAMKRFYGQGWFRTLVKFSLLSFSYMIAFTFVVAGLFLFALLMV